MNTISCCKNELNTNCAYYSYYLFPICTGDWSPIPRFVPNDYLSALQYLSTLDQLLVKQKVEIIEGIIFQYYF